MQIDGDPTLDDLVVVTGQEGEFIMSASSVVDTLIDVTKLGQVPQGFLGLMPRIASMPAANHKNAGRKVVVGVGGVGGVECDRYGRPHGVARSERGTSLGV